MCKCQCLWMSNHSLTNLTPCLARALTQLLKTTGNAMGREQTPTLHQPSPARLLNQARQRLFVPVPVPRSQQLLQTEEVKRSLTRFAAIKCEYPRSQNVALGFGSARDCLFSACSLLHRRLLMSCSGFPFDFLHTRLQSFEPTDIATTPRLFSIS